MSYVAVNIVSTAVPVEHVPGRFQSAYRSAASMGQFDTERPE